MPGASTNAVHGGERTDPATGAVNAPVTLSTTYRYPELEDGRAAPYIYSRYSNPSLEAVEQKLAGLEGAKRSLLFASGMAAIQAVCQATLQPGDTLAVQSGVYGGTTAYLRDELARWGVTLHSFDAHAKPALPKGTKLIWMESITNPLLRVADLPVWAKAAKKVGARLAVDATFASPILQRPLELGADVVMHSATKYLGGHSDVTAGALSTNDTDLAESLFLRRRNLGPTLDPHAAYLLGRGMKTLALRVERQSANAFGIAQAAANLKGVVAVHYPGLPDHPDRAVAKRLLPAGAGGVVTLDLGTKARAVAFRRKVGLIVPASSLGCVESLVSLPIETSHAYATAASRKADGIGDGLVRISIGIEDLDDLVADLKRGLS
ncbi:MAG: PLP-dependent aspartate aminotransferase family protein [Candidatus Thermoplasmatota archaeon]